MLASDAMSGGQQGPGFLFEVGAGTGAAEVDGEPGDRGEGGAGGGLGAGLISGGGEEAGLAEVEGFRPGGGGDHGIESLHRGGGAAEFDLETQGFLLEDGQGMFGQERLQPGEGGGGIGGFGEAEPQGHGIRRGGRGGGHEAVQFVQSGGGLMEICQGLTIIETHPYILRHLFQKRLLDGAGLGGFPAAAEDIATQGEGGVVAGQEGLHDGQIGEGLGEVIKLRVERSPLEMQCGFAWLVGNGPREDHDGFMHVPMPVNGGRACQAQDSRGQEDKW